MDIKPLNAASTLSPTDGYDIATRMRRARVEFGAQYQVAVRDMTNGETERRANFPQFAATGVARHPSRSRGSLDISINDGSHYLLNDHGKLAYGRADSFYLDAAGYLVNANGQRLIGHNADVDGYLSGTRSDLRIDETLLPASATRTVVTALNLDPSAETPSGEFDPNDPRTYNDLLPFRVYDEEGRAHVGQLYLRKLGDHVWQSHLYIDGVAMNGGAGDRLTFDAEGALASVNHSAYSTTQTVTIDRLGNTAPHTFTIDYARLSETSERGVEGGIIADGHSYARLANLDVDHSGLLHGVYSNGVTKVLGKVAMAAPAADDGIELMTENQLASLSGKGIGGTRAAGVDSKVLEAINAQFDYLHYRVKNRRDR